MGWWLPFLIGCTNPEGSLRLQSPIQAQLVVHADPMVRGETQDCGTPGLVRCGVLQGEPWKRRTNNLAWLSERWTERGRTVDVQVGPDIAMAWAEEPSVFDGLVEEMGMDEARGTAERGRSSLTRLINSDLATLGLHGHAQIHDESGLWGDVDLPPGASPCEGAEEVGAAEWLLYNHSTGVAVLADELETDIVSLSSHTPRSMGGKIAAVEAPDDLEVDTNRSFPERYRPLSLSGGLTECFQHVADHSPFEAFQASDEAPLMAGGGPLIAPGHRVVGSMAPHLGVDQDGSLPAAERRLFQLMLNWRYAALKNGPERPWVFTFHAHLFDLHSGEPDPDSADARDRNAVVGQSFRGEVEALSKIVDEWTARPNWAGVGSTGDGVTEWVRVDEMSAEGSAFSYGDADDPQPSLDAENNPYLHLVSTVLANGHKVCEAAVDGGTVYGFERCDAGWSWGAPARGYGCRDGNSPTWVGVIVPDQPNCVAVDPSGLRVAPADGDTLSSPTTCAGGLWVPEVGLIVEAGDDASLPAVCGSG